MKKPFTRFLHVETLLVLVVLLVIGGTAWFVWKTAQTTNKALDTSNVVANEQQPKVTEKKVVDYESCKKAAGSKVSTAPDSCTAKDGKTYTSTKTSAPAESFLVIQEWGVKLSLSDPVLSGAMYAAKTTAVSGVEGMSLMTKDTENMSFKCDGASANDAATYKTASNQDALLRSKSADSLEMNSNRPPKDFTKIGDYYYVYAHNTGYGNCEIADATVAAKAAAVADAYGKSVLTAK